MQRVTCGMDFSFTSEAGLAGLFVVSFLSATLLPGGSELALLAFVTRYPEATTESFVLATIGNTLGGMSSYMIGRLLPDEKTVLKKAGGNARGLEWVRRHGTPILLLSWTPLIGDLLCVAAGWLRTNWLWALLFIAAGKFARYWVIAIAVN